MMWPFKKHVAFPEDKNKSFGEIYDEVYQEWDERLSEFDTHPMKSTGMMKAIAYIAYTRKTQ